MSDLVSQLVAELEDMRGKVIELCQTYGNPLPDASLERTEAALSAAKAGGWVAVPDGWSITPKEDGRIVLRSPDGEAWSWDDAQGDGTSHSFVFSFLAAMLAARPLPAPPAQKDNT